MIRICYILFILSLIPSVYAQNLDLVVNQDGDSIACKIDSLTEDMIYFTFRSNGRWTPTHLSKERIADYKINAFRKKDLTFRHGTSIIIDPRSKYINQISRNSIYGTGSSLIYHYTANINYERIFSARKNDRITRSGYRLSYGIIDGNGHILQGTLNFLLGKRNSYFEINTGATYINEPSGYESDYISVVLNAGYRRQKSVGGCIYRFGIGTPEGLYISVGVSF